MPERFTHDVPTVSPPSSPREQREDILPASISPQESGNGNGNGTEGDEKPEQRQRNDAEARRYATPPHQEALRRAIESQDLPVRTRLEELTSAIVAGSQRNGITLLQGETGSGKSIYSPVAVAEALNRLGLPSRTIMMQPRRDAARGVARAVAAVTQRELGREVGFSTSEAKEIQPDTEIGVVTPGIFLRYLKEGSLTKREAGALIIDELHEGSIEYHLALGLLKLMRERGEAPLVLLTSATVDKERIMNYFGIAEEDYLRIEGRTYPVEKHFLKEESEPSERSAFSEKRRDKTDYLEEVALTVKRLCAQTEEGDVLVFLPGMKEINEVIQRIGDIKGVEVLPLHGTLGPEERDTALSGRKPSGIKRRVIVATNIAETSVTVPGVTMVVDSCRQRSIRFNPANGINETGTEFISKGQAEQRAGRAGRMSAGVCHRIITESEYHSLREHPESEIRRKNIASVVLQTKSMGIPPEDFPFIDPPEKSAIDGAVEELKALGALDASGNLTALGYEMNEMAFEPRLARMILYAKEQGCLPQALVIAAFAREGNVLRGPTKKDSEDAVGYSEAEKKRNARRKVQELQAHFNRGGSDFLKNLNIFAEAIEHGAFEASRGDGSFSARKKADEFREWCRKMYLNETALRHIAYKLEEYVYYLNRGKEGRDRVFLDRSTLADTLREPKDVEVGSSLLSAYADKVLCRTTSGGRGMQEYEPLDGAHRTINISPGSVAFESAPAVCIATEMAEGSGTSRGMAITRTYASNIQPIAPRQIRALFPSLIAEESTSTLYHPDSDSVVERVLVYLTKKSKKIFLEEESREVHGSQAVSAFASALAEGGYVDVPCVRHNRRVLEKVSNASARAGGRLKSPDMKAWYEERLGTAQNAREAEALGEKLYLTEEEVFPEALRAELDTFYPEEVVIGTLRCTLTYEVHSYASPTEKFIVRIGFPSGSIAEILSLTSADVPKLGKDGDGLRVFFEIQGAGRSYRELDLGILQEKIEMEGIRQAWRAWKAKPHPKPIDEAPMIPLPTPESLKAEPIPYAHTRKGEPVWSYPALATVEEWSPVKGAYESLFYLDYFPSREEAEQSTEAAERAKRIGDAKEAQRVEQEKQFRNAKERLETVIRRRDEIGNSYKAEGFSETMWREVTEDTQTANARLSAQERSGGERALSETEGLIAMVRKIETVFQRADRLKTKRPQFEVLTKQAQSELAPIVQKVLLSGDYGQFQITESECQVAREAWGRAEALMSEEGGDLIEANELLAKVHTLLFSEHNLLQRFGTSVARDYLKMSGHRERNVVSKIRVRGGLVFDQKNDFSQTRLEMNDSLHADVYSKGGRAWLVLSDGYGQKTGTGLSLLDGQYCVLSGGEVAFRVEMNARGTVTEVTDKVVSTKVPFMVTPDREDREYSGAGFEPVLPQEGLGSLEQAFDQAKKSTPEGEVSSDRPLPSGEFSLRPVTRDSEAPIAVPVSPEYAKEHPLSPEAREALIREMETLETYLARIRSVGKKVNEPTTPREKNINAFLEKASVRQREMNALSTEIAGARTFGEKMSLEGKINSLLASIKSLAKSNQSLFPPSYTHDWFDTYRSLIAALPGAIKNNELASGIISEGLATEEDFVSRLKARIPELEKGRTISIATFLDEVVDDLTR